MRFRFTIGLTLALMSLMVPALVFADAGDGLRAGRFVISPSLTLTGAYDTNLFYQSSDETTEPSRAPSVGFTPALSMSMEDVDVVDFSGDAQMTWQQYLDSEDAISGQSGLSTNLGLQLGINRKGAFSLTLEERFERTNEPPTSPTVEPYNRNLNSAGLTLGLHPGGQVFQHFLGYKFHRYFHDDLPLINRNIHSLNLKNYWRFLPRTAVVLNANLAITDYDTADRGQGFANVNSTPLRISGGLTGLITQRVSARLVGGWGLSFHDEGQSFSGFLVDGQLGWQFGNKEANNKLYLGFEQGFTESTIANFVQYYRPYAGLGVGIARDRIRLDFEVEARIRDYEGTPQSSAEFTFPETLSDTLVSGRARASFKILNWWSAFLGYRISTNITDDRITNNTFGSEAVRDYVKNVVTFGTTVRY